MVDNLKDQAVEEVRFRSSGADFRSDTFERSFCEVVGHESR